MSYYVTVEGTYVLVHVGAEKHKETQGVSVLHLQQGHMFFCWQLYLMNDQDTSWFIFLVKAVMLKSSNVHWTVREK